MRKIYLILLFTILYNVSSQGQCTVFGTSTYRISVSGRVGFEGSTCGQSITGGLQWIALIRKDDIPDTGYTLISGTKEYPNSGRGIGDQDYNTYYDFTKSNPVEQIKWNTTRRSKVGVDCKSTDYNGATRSISICQKISYDFKDGLGLNQPGYTDIQVFPKIAIDKGLIKTKKFITDDGYLTILLSDNIDNGYYNWEFSVGGVDNFRRFPSIYNNQPTLRLRGMDFLSDSDFGKPVYIRVNMGNCADSTRISNTVDFPYKKSSPQIQNITSTDKTCFGAANGRLKVQLDRSLLTGERLMVDYKNLTTLSIGNISDPIMGSDNSFYLENLDTGDYEIQVSGFYNGFTTYSDGPNHKKTAKVENFDPIAYSTANKTDITCFGAKNGSITVTTSGGDGNYKLHWRKQGSSYGIVPFTSGSRTTLSNLEPGVYEYYVTDNHDCELRDQYGIVIRQETLAQPAKALNFTFASFTEPSGYGRSDGSIVLSGDGGSPLSGNSYRVVWKNKITNQTVTTVENDPSGTKFRTIAKNIPAGTYIVEIYDKNNCYFTNQITIGQPKQLTVAVENIEQILCNGNADGKLVAHARGGILSVGQVYSYRWFKKNGANYQALASYTDSIAPNLSKGDYKVEVSDKSRIVNITSKEFTLNEPSTLATSLTKQDVTCFRGNNGSIRIVVSGGVGGYKLYYKRNDDVSYSQSSNLQGNIFTLNNLEANEYWLYITDANGCNAPINGGSVAQITIGQPKQALEISNTAIKPVSGFGRSDGSITIKVKGGTPNLSAPLYNVTWKNTTSGKTIIGNVSVDNGVFTSKVANLLQGIYSVEVKDKNYAGVANACYITENFTVIQPEKLTLQLENSSGINCYGEETGELIAHVKGGVSGNFSGMPYNYKWYKNINGTFTLIANQNDSILTNRSAGFYKVSIEDASSPVNTIESDIFEISQPALLVTTLSTQNIGCYAENTGFIHIKVSGGTGAYKLFCKKDETDVTYKEFPINEGDNTFYLDNLYHGKYTMYILDANNCYAKINGDNIHEIILTQPMNPLSITDRSQVNVSGFGRSDGNIKITIDGGTPNTDNTYNVIWKNETGQILQETGSFENGKYVSLLNNIPQGNYSVEIKDRNYEKIYLGTSSSCAAQELFSISQPDKLLANIEESHFISCNGMSDGQLIAHIRGGTSNPVSGNLPYIYKWYKEELSEGYVLLTNEKDSVLSNISTGNYKIEIEDYSRIVNTVSVKYNLKQPDVLQASATNSQIICGQTATISAYVSGGTAPYSYEWSTGDKTASVDNITPGRYFVFVTDSRGCETTAIAEVSTPEGIQISGIATDPICYGANNGNIELQVTGGTAPYTYIWDDGRTDKNLNNLKSGLYTVLVTDKDGCTYTENFILSDPDPLTVYLGEDRTLCNKQSLILAPEVADPKTKFSWSGPNSLKATSPQITVDKAGTYRLTITDSKGCQATDEINIKVENIDISSEIFVATEVFAGDTVVIANISNPNPERMEWLIEDSDSLKIVDIDQHYARVIFSETGYYKIGFRAHEQDCFQETFKTITVVDKDGTEEDLFGESIIEKYYVYPNPNDGNFNVKITLNKISAIRLRIINVGTGNTVSDKKYTGQKEYDIPYNMPIAPGVYVIVLETSSGHMNLKMIVR